MRTRSGNTFNAYDQDRYFLENNQQHNHDSRQYHVNHAHPHPGVYTDKDEHHRHRKRDNSPKTETVVAYKRRKPY